MVPAPSRPPSWTNLYSETSPRLTCETQGCTQRCAARSCNTTFAQGNERSRSGWPHFWHQQDAKDQLLHIQAAHQQHSYCMMFNLLAQRWVFKTPLRLLEIEEQERCTVASSTIDQGVFTVVELLISRPRGLSCHFWPNVHDLGVSFW